MHFYNHGHLQDYRHADLFKKNSRCPLGLVAFLLLWQHYCFQTLQLWWDQIISSWPGASDKSNLLISQVRGEWPDKGRPQPLVSRAAASLFASLTLMSLTVLPLKRRSQSQTRANYWHYWSFNWKCEHECLNAWTHLWGLCNVNQRSTVIPKWIE